uniref:Oxysterol-binding protein n=1 Tax=Knipowitschia caucasica TaxID=637954 RepID=A0AAV2IW23_KNICA
MNALVKSLPSPSLPGLLLPGPDMYRGWLFKWTNYLKGYQRRWCVLSNGLLSYYRTQAEMAHTCRGTISLATAHIEVGDTCHFVLTSEGRTYHLKAASDGEAQRWGHSLWDSRRRTRWGPLYDSGDDGPQDDRLLDHGVLQTLSSRLDDLSTCNELIGKHGAALQRSLTELEEADRGGDRGGERGGERGGDRGSDRLKAVNERATLFRITSNAMINACQDFVDVAESHSRRWQKALQYEREQRHHLEETIEQLAKQHNSLETAWREKPSSYSVERPQNEDHSDDNEEPEFFDAMEDSPAFITVAATSNTQHKRSGSNQSMSGGTAHDWSLNDNDSSVTNHRRVRRCRIPDKPNYSLNLWSIMKNCIGKDLSRIPMPVSLLWGHCGLLVRLPSPVSSSVLVVGLTPLSCLLFCAGCWFDSPLLSPLLCWLLVRHPSPVSSSVLVVGLTPLSCLLLCAGCWFDSPLLSPLLCWLLVRLPSPVSSSVLVVGSTPLSCLLLCAGCWFDTPLLSPPLCWLLVNFNEPLSMLQRLSEDLEYSELLDRAARCSSSLEQMCFVAAFSVSSYSTTVHRTAKPFNPLLGETYELDRLEEAGYRSLCEQVSHHPPAAALHASSQRGWSLWQHITIDSKFRGKYISVMPLGNIHLHFHASGNHYVWSKVTSTVHNIIVGKLWIDQSGDIEIVNRTTKDTCRLKFSPYSYFSRDVARKVSGVVEDRENTAHYVLSGTWDDKMESSKVVDSSEGSGGSEGKQKTVYQTLPPKLLWKKYPLP